MSKIKGNYECALILTHDLVGGKWKLRILWHIIHGDNRFSLLKRNIPDISQKVLGSQLKELEESGILEKEIVDDNPPKIILYHLSREYEQLEPVIEAICTFTRRYAADHQIQIND